MSGEAVPTAEITLSTRSLSSFLILIYTHTMSRKHERSQGPTGATEAFSFLSSPPPLTYYVQYVEP